MGLAYAWQEDGHWPGEALCADGGGDGVASLASRSVAGVEGVVDGGKLPVRFGTSPRSRSRL